MPLLLDMILPPSLAVRLTQAGYPAAHVVERSIGQESDERIVDHARASGDTLVTNDQIRALMNAVAHQREEISKLEAEIEKIKKR